MNQRFVARQHFYADLCHQRGIFRRSLAQEIQGFFHMFIRRIGFDRQNQIVKAIFPDFIQNAIQILFLAFEIVNEHPRIDARFFANRADRQAVHAVFQQHFLSRFDQLPVRSLIRSGHCASL